MLPERAISKVCICHINPVKSSLTHYNSHPFSLQLLPSSLCHSYFIALHYINLSITSSSSLLYTRGRRAPGSTGHSPTLTVRHREVDLKDDHSRSVVLCRTDVRQHGTTPASIRRWTRSTNPQSSDSPPAVNTIWSYVWIRTHQKAFPNATSTLKKSWRTPRHAKTRDSLILKASLLKSGEKNPQKKNEQKCKKKI
jgi:hypothetical protein